MAAVAGTAPGWRRAALSLVESERVVEIGQSTGSAVIGNLVGTLPVHSPMLYDVSNRPILRLLHAGMRLPPGTGNVADFDAPAIWLGGEIIRYANAAQIAPLDYEISGLQRCCFGASASAPHPGDSAFFLIDGASLTPIDSLPLPIGATLEVEALGLADSVPASAGLIVTGAAITPRTPVHGTISQLPNGDIELGWIRRERLNFGWADGIEIPNSDGADAFVVDMYHGGQLSHSWTTGQSLLTVPASLIASLGLPPGALLAFEVRQLGRHARSAPLTLDVHY